MDPSLAIEVAAMSQQETLNDITALGDSEVQRFYNNSVIFLTGGSGFLGKQLIEKLCRSCRISKLFMLLRTKKGKSIQKRLEDVLHDPVFNTLRKQQPDFRDKIVAVEGDAAEIRLGINKDDWKVLSEEVNVMFHVAATTKFDETLRLATLINVRGTREAMLLGKSCENLRSYVHVSTAYSHATTKFIGKEIREEFYKAPILPETMISMAENVDADILEGITKEMIKEWPNTYTFTKSLSEELVRTTSVGLPICIVRPGVVTSCYREPSAGWLDFSCVYGASGVFFGVGLGMIHTIFANPNNKAQLIPCDYVNNAIIVSGRETATNQAKGGMDTKIYTVTTAPRNPSTWRHIICGILSSKKYVNIISTPAAVYYVFLHTTTRFWLYMILSFFLHIIPAYIADAVCLLLGKQRKFVKIAHKMYKMCSVMSYFMINEWKFVDDNLDKLYNDMSNHDKTIFNFDVTDINWIEYYLIWCIGIRKYIVKDGLKNTNYAVRKQKYLRIVHYFLITLYVYGIWKLLSSIYALTYSTFLNIL